MSCLRRSELRSERGAAIGLVVLSMVVLISMIALSVDVGLLMSARTEAQRVADLSALAGAGILAIDPEAEDEARAEAIKFAAFNSICDETCKVSPGDVDVDLDAGTVTVRVLRTEASGAPIEAPAMESLAKRLRRRRDKLLLVGALVLDE